jgi:glyoxylase-like metal-dependent hydrolase (beta-lactamase superfamily II)/cyclopropane fatty-acyl-phospholipid synthase-like methyltransferase
MRTIQVPEGGMPISVPAEASVSGVLRRPRLLRVTDRVYSAVDYAISNVLYVITGSSVVVIDTTESMTAARLSFDEFRKICPLPVSYIVYTHFHGDHIRGARVFLEQSTRVIAQKRLPEELAYVTRMHAYRKRATALQFGLRLKPERRGVTLADGGESGYVPPHILFDEEYRFHEGELSFEFYHTQGETADHLMVWIPEERALFPGDLYYARFPMLSSPMRPDRPVQAWAESLERMRTFQPQHLVPSHSEPVSGAEKIDLVLSNYARAIRYVHDETIKGINEGLPLEDIRRQMKLPDDLAALPYLEERYGTVAWSVNGIFRQHTGWYHFDPADLNPGARCELREALLEATGGPGPLVKRARKALREGQHQLALELADTVLGARPENLGARAVRFRALRRLAEASQNGVEQNIYRTAANEALSALDSPAAKPSGAGRLNYSGVWMRPATEYDSAPARVSGAHQMQERTAAVVNQWYDERMFADWAAKNYAGSDFHNIGFWTDQTRTQKEACENLMEALLAFLPDKSGEILDVACGKGATTRYLLKYYSLANVTGINISEKQLRRCRLNAPQCQFLHMNATSMTFKDGAFDQMICVEAAHHFADWESFLKGAYRILRPGGRLVLSDILPSAQRGAAGPLCPRQSFMSPSDYRDRYLHAGFEQVEVIDATCECIFGLRKHNLRSLRDRWLGGVIDLATFRAGRDRIRRKEEDTVYYLLVCAQKGDS